MSHGIYEFLPPTMPNTLQCEVCGMLQVNPQTQPCGVCRENIERERWRAKDAALAEAHEKAKAAAPWMPGFVASEDRGAREPARPVETASERRWNEIQRAQRSADYLRDEEERYQEARQRGLENEAQAGGAQWCGLHHSFRCNC